MRFIIAAAAAVLLAACASTQSTKPAAKAIAPPAKATASGAPAATPDKFATIDGTNIVEAQKAGYKVVNDNGQNLFCKRDLVTGTRLKYRTTCLTAAQLQEVAAKGRESVTPAQIPYYDRPTGR